MRNALVFPDYRRGNPYQKFEEEAYLAAGVSPRYTSDISTFLSALRLGPDVVQVEWTNLLAHNAPDAVTIYRQYARFLLGLQAWSTATPTGSLVWTVHNALEHETSQVRLERAFRNSLGLLADRIHLLSPVYPTGLSNQLEHKTLVAGIPAYAEAEASVAGVSAHEARSLLGLPLDEVIFLQPGQIRPYKNLHETISAFERYRKAGGAAFLYIVGSTRNHPDPAHVARLTSVDGVRLVDESPGDKDFALWHRASDAVVLNYTQILNSSSLTYAQSLACPVVAPAKGAVPWAAGGKALLFADETDLVKQLHVIEDPVTRAALGEAGRRHVHSYFSRDNTVNRLVAAVLTSVEEKERPRRVSCGTDQTNGSVRRVSS